MTDELMAFLTRNLACPEGLDRLAATGAKTPDEAWTMADARDLVWAVTRPGVMSDDQRRRFLAAAVLAPVEHLFRDERSKNILQKLRTNEQITDADKLSAADADADAAASAVDATWAAAAAAAAAADADAAYADADAAAAWAADAAAYAARAAAAAADASRAADAAYAAAAWAADAAAYAARAAYASRAAYAAHAAWAARNAQARWIRENIKLSDLHIN